MSYQPKTGARCTCKRGIQRDNCSACEGTGWAIDFEAIRRRALETPAPKVTPPQCLHMACKFCDLDIEGMAPFSAGQWRDRGNNATCPHGANKGKPHAPYTP